MHLLFVHMNRFFWLRGWLADPAQETFFLPIPFEGKLLFGKSLEKYIEVVMEDSHPTIHSHNSVLNVPLYDLFTLSSSTAGPSFCSRPFTLCSSLVKWTLRTSILIQAMQTCRSFRLFYNVYCMYTILLGFHLKKVNEIIVVLRCPVRETSWKEF